MRTGEKETATIESAETVNGPSTIGGAMGIALEETLFQWFQWYNDSARPIENPALLLAAVVADISSDNPYLMPGSANPVGLYKNQALVACRDRRIAVTEQGYLGLVPACSQIGDELYLLGGATVPFVLRQKNTRKFLLVGDSYIDGVMEGEVAETISQHCWEPICIY
ncbi:hypothetical protein J3E74DRAFT_294561 [Bipolaris maydis]|nr:hypothetical protein J3E74DRAFT_294561 [Bipolaris maydis]